MRRIDGDYATRNVVWFAILAFGVITAVTGLSAPSLHARFYPLLPDKGPTWYFWQLPVSHVANRIAFWGGYALHQLTVWGMLIFARRRRNSHRQPMSSRRVAGMNVLILAVNLLFVLLHYVQTQMWYDGLAKDVPIWTSQGSVIVMLILMLYLMVPRRGLFWGRGHRLVAPWSATFVFVRRWHGLYISWAVVYTFWFHPMDGNWGLLSGFVYMFLLFIQLSLFNTSFHLNRAWIVLLEVFVAVHGTLITLFKHSEVWPMFLFGFLFMFTFTQIHSWSHKELPRALRWMNLSLYVAAIVLVYALFRGFNHLFEVLFIPAALYGGALVLIGIDALVELARRRRDPDLRTAPGAAS